MGLLGSGSRKRAVKPTENEEWPVVDEYREMHKPWREEDDEFLSWSSSIFHQPYLNVGIIYVMGFKTPVNYERIKKGFDQFRVQYAPFTSLQVMDKKDGGKMRWVRIQINLEKHIIVPALNLDAHSPDKVIENYVSNLRNTPLDFSKPLWEFHILNLKSSEAEATGVFWVHHSLGDGTSLVSLLLDICRKTEDAKAPPSLPKGKSRTVTANPRGVRGLVSMVWKVLIILWNSMVGVWGFLVILMSKDSESPLRGRPGVESAPRRFAHRTVSLEDIKLVKNVMNVTINDVVLGTTQAALAKYIYGRYDENKTDQEVKEKKKKYPKKICLRAAVMVDLRPSSGAQALANLINRRKQVKLGNWVGFIFLPLNIQMKDDSLDYIREAKAVIDRKKNSLEAKVTFYASWLISILFGTKTVSAVIHKVWSRTTLTFSNVVGPLQEISLCGHPAAYLAPTAYGPPQALIIHLHNYANKMTFSISVDERNIPNPHQLCDDFEESLRIIKDAAETKGATLFRKALSSTK